MYNRGVDSPPIGTPSAQAKVPAAAGKSSASSSVASTQRGLPRSSSAFAFTSASASWRGEPSGGGGGSSAIESGTAAAGRYPAAVAAPNSAGTLRGAGASTAAQPAMIAASATSVAAIPAWRRQG